MTETPSSTWPVPQDAAETLAAILAAIPATGTDRDRRVREAIRAAAGALERHEDPHRAILTAYGRAGDSPRGGSRLRR